MCPEKERLMREFQRQVSHFEATMDKDGLTTISHRRAIKEYSRSSADQEIPLAHELRPARVLRMTMLYLLHEIADLCEKPETSLADWYHFVWDRTRSIRKDITQQELCSASGVQLVEQCARFHIHCAARLVAEDYAVFDKKINAENLTKCLQTLKYMYHDLRLKQVHCPCEAEFRSYIVLLNLGNANFLWELKQLPQHIQSAPEIKRAIAFYNALQHNNYVRFFNMIRDPETSYLSACILLGYFTKLRFCAFEAINKSYKWPKSAVALPVDYFVHILGFEHVHAAVNFFRSHGVDCDNQRVLLSAPRAPDSEYCMERALQLVESKRRVSVGECIAGEPLDSADCYARHQPHNSFNEQGLLKPEAWMARDQSEIPTTPVTPVNETGVNIQFEQQPFIVQQAEPTPPPPPAPTPTPTPTPSLFAIPQLVENEKSTRNFSFGQSNIFNVVNTMPTKSFQGNIFGIPQQPSNRTQQTTGNIFAKEHENIFRIDAKNPASLFKNVVEEQQIADSQEEDQEEQDDDEEEEDDYDALKEIIADKDEESEERWTDDDDDYPDEGEEEAAAEDLDDNGVDDVEIVTFKHADEQVEERRRQQLDMKACQVYDALIGMAIENAVRDNLYEWQALNEACTSQAHALFAKYSAALIAQVASEELHDLGRERSLLRRAFHNWLTCARRKTKKRRLLQSLPVFVTTQTRAEQTAQLCAPQLGETIGLIKRYRQGAACDFPKLLWHLGERQELNSLDICRLLAKHLQPMRLTGRLRVRKYFKLLLTLPADHEELPGLQSLLNTWLQVILKATPASGGAYMCTLEHDVAVCVRKLTGANLLNESGAPALQGECDHADAVICFMSGAQLAAARQRLQQLFKRARNFKPLPLALLVLTTGVWHDDVDAQRWLAPNQLSAQKCYEYAHNDASGFRTQLQRALSFLAQQAAGGAGGAAAPTLELQYCSAWLDRCLGAELWHSWQRSRHENITFRQACCSPHHVVSLYNEALQRLQQITCQRFDNQPEFPTELRQFVTQLDNDLPLTLEYFPVHWKSLSGQHVLVNLLQALKLPTCVDENFVSAEQVGAWCISYASVCLTQLSTLEQAYISIRELLEAPDMQLPAINFLTFIRQMAQLHANEVLSSRSEMPKVVVYERAALQAYIQQPWWLKFTTNTELYDCAIDEEQLSCAEDDDVENLDMQSSVVDDVVQHAESVLLKSNQNVCPAPENSARTLTQHRLCDELNRSLRNFEVTQLIGAYDMPVALKRQQEGTSLHNGEQALKIKRSCDKEQNEVDAVVAKALALIQKIEMRYDSSI